MSLSAIEHAETHLHLIAMRKTNSASPKNCGHGSPSSSALLLGQGKKGIRELSTQIHAQHHNDENQYPTHSYTSVLVEVIIIQSLPAGDLASAGLWSIIHRVYPDIQHPNFQSIVRN